MKRSARLVLPFLVVSILGWAPSSHAAHPVTFNVQALTGEGEGVRWGVLGHPVNGAQFIADTSHTYSLDPGSHAFITSAGNSYHKFDFTVTESGTVTCPSGAIWLANCGTPSVTVLGVTFTVDASHLTGESPANANWAILGATPANPTPVKTANGIPGTYTFALFSGVGYTQLHFKVDGTGAVSFGSLDQSAYLAISGASTLVVNGLRIVIDCSDLTGPHNNGTSPQWAVFGSTPDAPIHIKTAWVIPGVYVFREHTGLSYNSFQFEVGVGGNGVGVVTYDPSKTFLQGSGTDTLRVVGFEISIDASALTGHADADWFVGDVTLVNQDPVKRARLIPGNWPFIELACLSYNLFHFTVSEAGQVGVKSADAGFASAAGSKLTVRGYDIATNGCQAPARQPFRVCGASAEITSTDCKPVIVTVIPGRYYVYRQNVSSDPFSLDVTDTGLVEYPESLNGQVFGRGQRYLYLGGTPQSCLVSSCGKSDCDMALEKVSAALARLETDLQKAAGGSVMVKGATPAERVENLVAAISKLNTGQKKALVKTLLE